MKKDLQLCGLGNALVDIQIQVHDDDLDGLGANKGEMALVESARQTEILQRFSFQSSHKCSGGSAANTIIAFSEFGGKAAYKTLLGNDNYGEFYSREFKDLGIVLKADKIDTSPTGTCLILITPDAERTMLTSLGASAEFGIDDIDEEIIRRSEWLYIEGYKFSGRASTEAVIAAIGYAKKYGTKIAVTFSDIFIIEAFRDNLSRAAAGADLIFCNAGEAIAFTNTQSVDAAFSKLGEICPNVVVTLGNKGSKVKWGDEILFIPPYPAKAIDTTGAGDMFAGAFLYGIISAGSPLKAGHLASYSSSRIVSQMGARLNTDYAKLISSELISKVMGSIV